MGYLIENLKDNFGTKKVAMFFLLLFVLIILVLAYIFYFVSAKPSNDYIIVGESAIFTKSKGKWTQIKRINDDILSAKYTVVHASGINENVTINYTSDSNYWLYMDDEFNDIELKHVKAAYTSKFKNVKVADYEFSYYDDSDQEILSNVLEGRNILDFEKSVKKYTFDLDGDGVLESIYTLTNETLSGRQNKKYSSIFLVRGDEFIKTFSNDTTKPYKVMAIVDIDNDNKYEVIVSKGDLDVSYFDSCYQIYKVVGNKISLVKDC